MAMFSRMLDALVQPRFRKDNGGRLVFIPKRANQGGYYVAAGDESKIKSLIKLYMVAGALINMVGVLAACGFTQSMLFDERACSLRKKLEFGMMVYAVSAFFLLVLPALLLWKVYSGVIADVCSSLQAVGGESVAQMVQPSNQFRTRLLLVLLGTMILLAGVSIAISYRP